MTPNMRILTDDGPDFNQLGVFLAQQVETKALINLA